MMNVLIKEFFQDGNLIHQARFVGVEKVGEWIVYPTLYVYDCRKWNGGIKIGNFPGANDEINLDESTHKKLEEIYCSFISIGLTKAKDISC